MHTHTDSPGAEILRLSAYRELQKQDKLKRVIRALDGMGISKEFKYRSLYTFLFEHNYRYLTTIVSY